MATLEANILKDKFLMCVICDSLFDDPATLQCGHTYCRKCLTSLVKSRPDSIRDEVIPCALRCAGTKVPNPRKAIDVWTRQIKPSFVISNLMDEYKMATGQAKSIKEGKSMRKSTSQFSQCDKHRDELLKMICENCKMAICTTCWGTKHQDCTSVVLMETKAKNILLDVVSCKSKLTDAIEVHDSNIAKFQSMDEEIRQIRKDSQSKIREAFKKIYHILKKKESSLHHELDTLIDLEIRSNQEQIQSEKKGLQRHQQRSHLIDQADKSGVLSAMYSINQSYMSTKASDDKDNCQSTYRALTHVAFTTNIDQLIESINRPEFGKLDVRYETISLQADSLKISKTGDTPVCGSSSEVMSVPTDRSVQIIKTARENAMRGETLAVRESIYVSSPLFRARLTADTVDSPSRETSVVPIDPQNTKRSNEQLDMTHEKGVAKSELFRSPVLADTTQCKLPDDESFPDVRDVTVLDVEGVHTVVVTDCNNKCVKAFYTRNKVTWHRTLLLDTEPWCVTKWKKNQIMTALRGSRKILTVAINPDLVLLSTITTSKKYYSLAALSLSRLAAGSVMSECVDILNIEGQVIKSVSINEGIKPSLFSWLMSEDSNVKLFSSPWYMCVNSEGDLLVSDSGKETVTCLTSDGNVRWVYAPTGDHRLQWPTGIKSTQAGIMLVDCNSHKVLLLTESGQYVRDALTEHDGLHVPSGIYVAKDNSLFVCCGSEVKHFTFTASV